MGFQMRLVAAFCRALLCAVFVGQGLVAQVRQARLLDHQGRVQVAPVEVLNSRARETNLSVMPDGSTIYFMSLRGGQYWSQRFMEYKQDSVWDGDLWYSERVGGRWQKPKCLPYGVNTESGEDEPNIAPNGKTVYFQSWKTAWPLTGGPYYQAQRTSASNWSKPTGLGGGLTEFFARHSATDGMAISPDGKTLIVAAGHDYDGKMDLYMSRKGPKGWSVCQKLAISTPGNERSCFIAEDGKTVFFASDGYKGFGGLDIFKATLREDGSVGEVVNIGAPFNTAGDDYGFVLTRGGMEAYFIRNEDIYFANLAEADPGVRPSIEVALTGQVKDKHTQVGLDAKVLVMDGATKRVLWSIGTGSRGRYSLSLPNKDANYDLLVVAEGGYPKEARALAVRAAESSQSYEVNFLLSREALAEPRPRPTPPPAKPSVAGGGAPSVLPPAPAPGPPPIVAPQLRAVEGRSFAPPWRSAPQGVGLPSYVEMPPRQAVSFEGVAKNNLVLLMDVSASMNRPERLPLLKESLVTLTGYMRPEDRISLIAYAGNSEVLLDGVSAFNQLELMEAIGSIRIGGDTRSRDAMRRAYEVAKRHFKPNGNNRIILATDGDFDVEELYNLAARNAANGISASIFAFGKQQPAKEAELKKLAQIANGFYTNVTPENMAQALVKEAQAVRN